MTKSAQSKQPKQPTLKSRKRNGGDYYYACINGKQYAFGYVSRDEAERQFAAKLNEVLNPPAEPSRQQALPELTVKAVLTRFLEWIDLDPEKTEATRDFYRAAIVGRPKSDKPKSDKQANRKAKSFVPFLEWLDKKHAALPVAHFGPMYVHQWIKDEFPGCSLNYRITLLRPIKAAFNWAAEQPEFDSRLPKNPLKGLKIQKCEPRKRFTTDDEWLQVKATATGPFLDLITVLEACGARPQELRAATAANLNHDLRCLYFDSQVKETGNPDPRVIFLTDEAFAICNRLAEQYPAGSIFRNKRGEPWKKNAIGCQCSRLRKKLGLPFSVYLLRHRFCQKELERGTPESELQHLMGHTDGRMIATTYNKWASRAKQLRESFDKRRSA